MKHLIIISAALFLLFNSCKKDPIRGCTDPNSLNYNPNATENDGFCITKIYGCMDPTSNNYNKNANVDDGSCKYSGTVTFWTNKKYGNITVYVSQYVGVITKYYDTYNPSCGSDGCATFNLPVGTYSFTANGSSSNWNNTVIVEKNKCNLMLLY